LILSPWAVRSILTTQAFLEQKLLRAGFSQESSNPQVHIINSCAVTEKSSLETHRHVKKLKAKILVQKW